MTFQLYFRLCH